MPSHFSHRARTAGAFAVTLALTTVLGACSADVSVGDRRLSEGQVEDRLMEKITEEAGQAPDNVDCPDDLDAEVGATMTCTLTAGTDELDIDVEVTAVDGDDVGDNVDFDYKIGQIKDGSTGGDGA